MHTTVILRADATRWVRGQQQGWEAGTRFGFAVIEEQSDTRLVGNVASCRVARKSRYGFDSVLPAAPPDFPHEGHRHTRHRTA